MTAVTKKVTESGRKTAGNLFSTSPVGTQRALDACEHAWCTGANALVSNPPHISQKLTDELISLQSQLTLLTRYFTTSAADRMKGVVNAIADTSISTVSEYERVFDLPVVQALGRLGIPIAEILSTLADRVASVSQELARLVAVQQDTT